MVIFHSYVKLPEGKDCNSHGDLEIRHDLRTHPLLGRCLTAQQNRAGPLADTQFLLAFSLWLNSWRGRWRERERELQWSIYLSYPILLYSILFTIWHVDIFMHTCTTMDLEISRNIDIYTQTHCVELPRYAALRAAVEAQIAAFQLVLQSHEAHNQWIFGHSHGL